MRTLTAVLALLLTAQAQAVNLMWMDRSPIQYFTSGDWQMLNASMKEALANSTDGVTSSWANPESGHSGTITPLESLTIEGHDCRRTRFTNETRKASGRLDVTLCETSPGKWLIFNK